MLIIGAGGFAKELLQIMYRDNSYTSIAFYDDVNKFESPKFFDEFSIFQNEMEVQKYFNEHGKNFSLGLGNPLLRERLAEKFSKIGGILCSVVSNKAEVGDLNVRIGDGTNILPFVAVSNGVTLGKGCLLYYHVVVTHDCILGNYVEVSPGAKILGGVRIGDYTQVGSGAVILPNIVVGENVTIGAGAVVTADVPNNSVVAGVPAKIIRIKTTL